MTLEIETSARYCETVKNVTVSLDDDTYRQARRRAAEDERSLSSVVREALQTYSAPPARFDHAARMKAIWAELDARGEGITVAGWSRSDMYDAAIAERGTLRD